MRFWDSSALVPLLVTEAVTASVLREYERDPEVLAWWATEVECASALCRLEREGNLSEPSLRDGLARLERLAASWTVVNPTDRARQLAVRLLRLHPLRAADALQLAAASLASEDDPPTLTVLTFDDRLAQAAQRQGFLVVRP
jgi:predicted nucleic acid-binding protein